MSSNKMVGTSTRDIRAIGKVTGSLDFAADVIMPGMLCGYLVRSEYAHARVKSIDISEALKVPDSLNATGFPACRWV